MRRHNQTATVEPNEERRKKPMQTSIHTKKNLYHSERLGYVHDVDVAGERKGKGIVSPSLRVPTRGDPSLSISVVFLFPSPSPTGKTAGRRPFPRCSNEYTAAAVRDSQRLHS